MGLAAAYGQEARPLREEEAEEAPGVHRLGRRGQPVITAHCACKLTWCPRWRRWRACVNMAIIFSLHTS